MSRLVLRRRTDVLVVGSRITEVGAVAASTFVHVVDGTDRFVLPGLVETF